LSPHMCFFRPDRVAMDRNDSGLFPSHSSSDERWKAPLPHERHRVDDRGSDTFLPQCRLPFSSTRGKHNVRMQTLLKVLLKEIVYHVLTLLGTWGLFLEVLKANNALMDYGLHMMYFREHWTTHALPSFHDYFSCTIMNVYSHAFIVQFLFLIAKLPRIKASSKNRESILNGEMYFILSLL